MNHKHRKLVLLVRFSHVLNKAWLEVILESHEHFINVDLYSFTSRAEEALVRGKVALHEPQPPQLFLLLSVTQAIRVVVCGKMT